MIYCDELYTLIEKLPSENEYYKKYEELIKLYPDESDKIDLVFYDLYKFEYNITYTEKRLDAKYRDTVKDKYKKCMITGKPDYLSQVAHIYPYALCNQEEKYDPENGFFLSAELHILFDTVDSKLRIDPETKSIILSEDVLQDNTLEEYHKYHNTHIKLSDKQIYYLNKKYT